MLTLGKKGDQLKVSGSGLVLLLIFFLVALPASSESRPQGVVVASTTMIGSMLELIAGDALQVQVLIPPASCPGHFDLKPRDAAGLSRAALIIRHDYQSYLDRKLKSQNPDLVVEVLNSPGHLVIPQVYLQALAQVKDILSAHFNELSSLFRKNFEVARRRLLDTEQQARKRIDQADLAGVKVLASFWQAEFLDWVGMEVCASFTNSPDELSVLRLKELVQIAAEKDVAFVAGNLHGGGEAVARGIAAEIGRPVCLLSNFPGTSERNSNYFDLLLDNISLLAQARESSTKP